MSTSILIIWLIIGAAFFIALWVRHFVKNSYPFLVVSGVGVVATAALVLKYIYDVFCLPTNGNFHDGIPITPVMRWLSGDDDFRSMADKLSGVKNGLIPLAVLLVIFIICIIVVLRERRKKQAA